MAFDLALGADGKTTVSVISDTGVRTLLRVGTNGQLDTTFASGGVLGFGDDAYGIHVAVDAMGRAYEVFANGATPGFVVRRYTAQGVLDTTYGTADGGGSAYSPPGDLAASIAIDASGKLLVSGGSGTQWWVLRLDATGTPHTSFDGDGFATVPVGDGPAIANKVVPLADGRILLGGFASTRAKVALLSASGALDATFGASGIATAKTSNVKAVRGVGMQPSGAVVVMGFTDENKDDFFLERFLPNGGGQPDATFGGAGLVMGGAAGPQSFQGASIEAPGFALAADGRIYVATVGVLDTHDEAALVRYTVDGQLDSTFGAFGVRVLTKSVGADALRAIAIQPDGKLIVGGRTFTSTGASDVGLFRVIP